MASTPDPSECGPVELFECPGCHERQWLDTLGPMECDECGAKISVAAQVRFWPDLDRMFLTVMSPVAPATTISAPPSPPGPTHLPMTVTLAQLAEWLRAAGETP